MKIDVDAVKSGNLWLKRQRKNSKLKKSKLHDRVSGKADIYASSGRKPALTLEIEKRIVNYVIRLL